jgi:uncharacterized protein (TIGR03067 family)
LAVSGCGGSSGTKVNADEADPGMAEKEVDGGGRDPKPASLEEEVKRLTGLWVLSRQEGSDGSFTVKGLAKGLLFEGGKVTDVYARNGEVRGKGTAGSYKLDVSRNPKTIDIRRTEKGKEAVTELGIYKLEKGTLTISSGEPGEKKRPQEFNRKKADIKYYTRANRGKQ